MARWNDTKYGEGEPTQRLRPNEPYFFLRAQDACSVPALEAYANELRERADQLRRPKVCAKCDDPPDKHGDFGFRDHAFVAAQPATDEEVGVAERLDKQARDVDAIIAHFEAWQANNPEQCKLPD